ncbi:unnamed protein product [Lota lota]
MIHIPMTLEFPHCGTMDLDSINVTANQDLTSVVNGRGRQRSHSYYSAEDAKNYGLHTETEKDVVRPRSRSFYSYETAETLPDECDENKGRSDFLWPKAASMLEFKGTKKEKKSENNVTMLLTSKKSKSKSSKHVSTKEHNAGIRGSLKAVSMLTISESDNWEISSSAGMKYGQFVDWEKIDPEAAQRYQLLLKSDHSEMKTMGRKGFWAAPHTLRAKAYYHIIHGIYSRSPTPDKDVYQDLARELFGEQKISTHPFPEYMEGGEIPRHCLNKAGLNSVKKILLCISKYFPEMNFCPILPALVSLILHFSEDEAECFHSVCRLIAYNDPNKRYVDQTFLTYRASCMTFGDLANKYCRGIRKLIASSHHNLFEFYSDWIMWIFADLPFTYAIRVLDVYLLEGYKVLYRVALALLSLYKVSVASRVAGVEDFRRDMKSFVENVARHCTVEKLLKMAFAIQMATRRELNLLFNANKDSLKQKGVSIHQKRQSVQMVDFSPFSSSVVTGTEMRVVWAWIPERFALFSPVQLFSTAEHGRSLATFYSLVEGHEPAVLILKTADEEVCGSFLSTDLTERIKHESNDYFGTGECFVFMLRPSMERYQRAMVNIMTRTDSSSSVSSQSSDSESCPNTGPTSPTQTLTCPAGTLQDPSYLTIPFTAASDEPITAKEPKRPKEQMASMFIAAGDDKLVIDETLSNSDSDSEVEVESDSDYTPTPATVSRTTKRSYSCSVCGKLFDRPSKLERHASVHTRARVPKLQCLEESSVQLENLTKDQSRRNRPKYYPCPDCGKVFSSPSKRERHASVHLRKPRGHNACSYCAKVFKKPTGLIRHERMHTGEKPFICSICGRVFSDPGHCKVHEKGHAERPQKPHRCADCGRCYQKPSQLRRHFRTHTGEKPFACALCNRRFFRAEGLKRHENFHSGNRPHKCVVCAKGFYTRHELNTHTLVHSGMKPHVCPVCGKGFSQLGNMREHERSIHRKTELHTCGECGASFPQSQTLKKHQRVHTGEKPYLCVTCGQRFAWSHCLSRHRRSHRHIQKDQEAKGSLLASGTLETSSASDHSSQTLSEIN